MNEFEKAREALLSDLRRYFVGPLGGEEEMIEEPAWDRYHIGMLYPAGTEVSPEEDDQESGGDAAAAESGLDDGIFALANVARQAACGMTFQIPVGDAVNIDVAFAEYAAVAPNQDAGTEGGAGQAAAKSRITWRRRPTVIPKLAIREGGSDQIVLYGRDGIEVCVGQRRQGSVRAVTVSVVNRRKERNRTAPRASEKLPEDRAIYQVQIRAYSETGGEVFVARPAGIHISDPEFVVHELLYRDVKQFAVGHGCAVDWQLAPGTSARARSVWLEWIPATEVRKASAVVPSLKDAKAHDLEFLATAAQKEVCDALDQVTDAYGAWIAGLDKRCPAVVAGFDRELSPKIAGAAAENLRDGRVVLDRIRGGISMLRSKNEVFKAFQLASRAMADAMRVSRPKAAPKWFPFQIAFILMSLPSTVEEEHEHRDVMDLIWFPTGGGKTEAYLGLICIVLFYRRIHSKGGPESWGTAVLTRYTLRLLTVQQFERAARTVMACELLRRKDEARFGKCSFSIGLFVGNSATPGSVKDAGEIIQGRAQPDETATTLPLTRCPWCNTTVAFRNQRIVGKAVVTACPNPKCDFRDGIPFACVDEQLFDAPPSVVIGTVDKFAMMAWEPKISELFGRGTTKRLPPSLIIQDELHLISDALGTVTALYEAAIDHLCSSSGGRGPKIIGSTATIRRAGEQAKRLYVRKLQQFPPSGLDYNDSFFYGEDLDNPGRLYVGVHAQGRSPKFTLARLVGTLSQGVLKIPDKAIQDHYYTLVAYFNSLRELGGAIVLAYDDVQRYIESMPDAGDVRRQLSVVQELTSYLPSHEIPNVLALMARGLLDRDADSAPIDLLLSTNMISVGVDVDRLGLMVVNGQPKTTSEYIQASSRVGRPKESAGLVVTLYNWTRPRDRSHYERFRAYHKSFYRYVEATTVTPFSPRARDRALHAVLFSLARLCVPELASNIVAGDDLTMARVKELSAVLAKRAKYVDEREAEHTAQDLEDILGMWLDGANSNATWRKEKGAGRYFLIAPSKPGAQAAVFPPTPQSMRDVDPPAPVRLLSATELGQVFGQEGT
jgi:hypothetical protein